MADRVAAAAAVRSMPPLKCAHLGRYGQAVLQTSSRENGRAVWIHYGYGKGHSHADALNLGLYAKGVDMLPDLGYPAYTGSFPERLAWTSNTASHNTLVVGDAGSQPSPGGKTRLFVDASPLRAIGVTCGRAYPKTAVYRRQVAMIDVGDDSYVLDVFRAKSGANHRLSWHGPAATATVCGAELAAQGRGSFAGTDAEPRQLDGPRGKFYQASGFTFRFSAGKVRAMRMAHARSLKAGGEELRCATPAYRGKVTRIDSRDPQDQRVFLDPPPPAGVDLAGKTIHFENQLPWDTSYDITARGGDWVSTGEITLVRGFRVAADFQSGYTYAVNPGDRYTVPCWAGFDR